MAVRRVRIVIRGVVQGVGFRYHTQEEARALRLTGFVRNRQDSSVEVEAEGDPQVIDALITWLRTGPRHAVVETLEIAELSATGTEVSFEIVR
jgi:acylphosphatase